MRVKTPLDDATWCAPTDVVGCADRGGSGVVVLLEGVLHLLGLAWSRLGGIRSGEKAELRARRGCSPRPGLSEDDRTAQRAVIVSPRLG